MAEEALAVNVKFSVIVLPSTLVPVMITVAAATSPVVPPGVTTRALGQSGSVIEVVIVCAEVEPVIAAWIAVAEAAAGSPRSV